MSVVHGESVFYEKGRGRWVGVLDLGTNGAGRRVRRRVTASSETEVKSRLRRLRGEIEAGASRRNGNLTVKAFLEDWLAREVPKFKAKKDQSLSPNTLEVYRWTVEDHLVPGLGHLRLAKLIADDVDDLLEAKAKEGMAKSSMVRIRSHLCRALDHAVRRQLVPQNVAKLTTVPDGPSPERRSLTSGEAVALFDAADGRPRRSKAKTKSRNPGPHRLRAMAKAGIGLSLRPGELLGLAREDVDQEDSIVHVRYQVVWERPADGGPKQPARKELKTRWSRRSLRCPEYIMAALVARFEEQDAERVVAGDDWCPIWGPAGLIFATQQGRPLSPANMRKLFYRWCDAAGIGHWVPYEMRHSGASLLSEMGVRLELVADTLGHKDTRMVDQVYRHRVVPTVEAAAEPMSRLFGEEDEGSQA